MPFPMRNSVTYYITQAAICIYRAAITSPRHKLSSLVLPIILPLTSLLIAMLYNSTSEPLSVKLNALAVSA
jgi:hypothetical protein